MQAIILLSPQKVLFAMPNQKNSETSRQCGLHVEAEMCHTIAEKSRLSPIRGRWQDKKHQTVRCTVGALIGCHFLLPV